MTAGAFPAQYDVDVALRDGSIVHVRPVRPQDHGDLAAFYWALSERSRWFRFFSTGVNLEDQARRAVEVDYRDAFGLVAVTEAAIVGHAQYIRMDAERAEIAFAVADAMQGRGLATVLLAHLAERAHEEGIRRCTPRCCATTAACSRSSARAVFRRCRGSRRGAGQSRCRPSLAPATLERFDERERVAAAAAVTRFLEPRAVAVIGASRRRGTVGGELLHNLIAGGFTGTVHPVNPAADGVQGAAAYPDIESRPRAGRPRGDRRPGRRRHGSRARVRARRACARCVVISAGFAETGSEGRAAKAELLRDLSPRRHAPVRPELPGGAQHRPRRPARTRRLRRRRRRPGVSRFLSQSGALGLAVMDQAARSGIGLSDVRLGRQQGRRVGQRLPATGTTTPRPTWCCSTSSRSATRAGSARIARRVAAASRSSRSRAGGRARAPSRPARTPARWSPHPTSRWTRCSRTPASSAPTRWPRCSTPRALLAHQPCRAAPRRRSSPTRAGPGSCARTRARRRTRGRRRCRTATRAKLAALLPAQASLQPGRHDRLGDERGLRAGRRRRRRQW